MSKEKSKQTMEELFAAVKKKDCKYDAVVCFSGGKDSTYLIWLAKNVYNLNVLAVSVNHPFLNNLAKANIKKIPEILGVNHVAVDVDEFLFNTFIKEGVKIWEQTRLSPMMGCQLCGLFHQMLPLNIAKLEGVPILLHGEDPSQVNGIRFGSDTPNPLSDLFYQLFQKIVPGTMYDPYYLQSTVVEIAPFSIIDYDHREVRKKLAELEILTKEESDPVSTNCTAFHFFAHLAFTYNDSFPYLEFIEYGLAHGYATTLDHILDTEENLDSERSFYILNDYRRVLNAIARNKEIPSTALPETVVRGMKDIHKYAKEYGVEL